MGFHVSMALQCITCMVLLLHGEFQHIGLHFPVHGLVVFRLLFSNFDFDLPFADYDVWESGGSLLSAMVTASSRPVRTQHPIPLHLRSSASSWGHEWASARWPRPLLVKDWSFPSWKCRRRRKYLTERQESAPPWRRREALCMERIRWTGASQVTPSACTDKRGVH